MLHLLPLLPLIRDSGQQNRAYKRYLFFSMFQCKKSDGLQSNGTCEVTEMLSVQGETSQAHTIAMTTTERRE